jgi:hypothetical protein
MKINSGHRSDKRERKATKDGSGAHTVIPLAFLLTRRMRIPVKCDKSPARRKTFVGILGSRRALVLPASCWLRPHPKQGGGSLEKGPTSSVFNRSCFVFCPASVGSQQVTSDIVVLDHQQPRPLTFPSCSGSLPAERYLPTYFFCLKKAEFKLLSFSNAPCLQSQFLVIE